MVKVFIVDNEVVIINCLQEMIHHHNTGKAAPKTPIQFVGSATNGEEAVTRIAAVKVLEGETLVVLMDIRMPVMDGLKASAQIKQQNPKVKILMLTGFSHKEYMLKSMHVSDGFISKNSSSEEIMLAIERCAEGELRFSGASEPEGLPPGETDDLDSQPPMLSPKQIQVVCLIANGCSTKDIAKMVRISVKTVESLKYSAMERLGIKGKGNAGLIVAAHKYKLCVTKKEKI